jgi:hypothetical protein
MRAKSILPSVDLTHLESLLTGVAYDAIVAGPRSGALLASHDDDQVLVLTVTDELQHALAAADDDQLGEVARPWSEKLGGGGDPASLVSFLSALAQLAREATSRGERLYCWVCV